MTTTDTIIKAALLGGLIGTSFYSCQVNARLEEQSAEIEAIREMAELNSKAGLLVARNLIDVKMMFEEQP